MSIKSEKIKRYRLSKKGNNIIEEYGDGFVEILPITELKDALSDANKRIATNVGSITLLSPMLIYTLNIAMRSSDELKLGGLALSGVVALAILINISLFSHNKDLKNQLKQIRETLSDQNRKSNRQRIK